MRKKLQGIVCFLLVILTTIAQAQTAFAPRKTWDGLFDIKMIAAPNLEAAYIDATLAPSGVLKVDSLIKYETMIMSGKKLQTNNMYKDGTPFKQISIPLPAVLCPDINTPCMQGTSLNTPNSSCPVRYNNPPTVSKYVSMTYADYDNDMSTFSSSMAQLNIPNCSEIESAYLYWAGNQKGADLDNQNITLQTPTASYNGSGDVFNVQSTSGFNSVKFKVPGGNYQAVTAISTHSITINGGITYVCVSDVTNLVKGAGSGQFWVANVQSYPNEQNGGSTSGWNLVVVFKSPLSTRRIISLWDGLEEVTKNLSKPFTLTGLTAPATANNFKSFVGFAALDGENFAAQLATATAPNNIPEGLGFQTNNGGVAVSINPFELDQPSYKLWDTDGKGVPDRSNGTDNVDACKKPLFDADWATVYDGISSSHVTTYDETTNKNGNEIVRLPTHKNTLGFDAHHLKLPDGAVAGGATTATLNVKAGPQGSTMPFMAYIAMELLQPKLVLSKAANKANAGLGDVVTYTLTVKNSGNAPSLGNDKITDTLDVVTDFVPASLSGAAGVTLVSSTNNIVNLNVAPVLNPGDSIVVSFQVKVKEYTAGKVYYDACKRTIFNTAYLNYNTISSGTIVAKSNNNCTVGSETKVSIIDSQLPAVVTKRIGPIDATTYRFANDNVYPHTQTALTNAGIAAADLNKYIIKDASNNNVTATDKFPATGDSVKYYGVRDYITDNCQERYEIVYTFGQPCKTTSGTATNTALNKQVCTNSPATMRVTGYSTPCTIQWQQSSNGINGWVSATGGSGATTDTYTTPVLTVKTYYRAKVQSGLCDTSYSNIDSVLISQPSVGGTSSPSSSTVCVNGTVNLALTGYTGDKIQWEQSTNGGTTWTNVTSGNGMTTANLITAPLLVTTQFRAKVTNGACAAANSTVSTVTVNPQSVGGTATASSDSICNAATANLSVSGNTGTTFQWQSSSNGTSWSNVTGGSGATTATYTSGALTPGTYYFRAYVASGVCPADTSVMDTLVVSPATVTGTVTSSNSSVCTGSSATLNVAGATGNIQWQQSLSGGGPWTNVTTGSGGTTSTFITAPLTATTYYRVRVSSGACAAANSNLDTVVVIPNTNGGTINPANATICAGSTQLITLTGSVGSIQWQQSFDGLTGWANVSGGSGATTASYTTAGLTTSTYFRAQVTSGGGACATVNSPVANITVDSISVGGTAAADPHKVCINNTSTITLSGYTGSIQWQQSATGTGGWTNVSGGGGATTNTYITPNLTTKTYYRARVKSGVCSTVSSTIDSVLVDPASNGGITNITASSVCSGTTALVNLAGSPVGTIQWEQSATGTGGWTNVTGGSGATTASYTSPNLTAKTYYRAKVTSGVCAPAFSSLDSVLIDQSSKGGTASASAASVCVGSSTSVSVTGATGAIQWQQSTTGTGGWSNINTATSATYTTPNLLVKTFYRAQVTSGACKADTSVVTSVDVDQPSKADSATFGPASVCEGSTATIKLTGTPVGTIQWEQASSKSGPWAAVSGGSGANTTSFTTGPLTTKTFFRANVKSGVCASDFSTIDSIGVDLNAVGGTASSADKEFCTTDTKPTLVTLSGHTGSSIQWQVSRDNATWKDTTASNPFLTTALMQTTHYRAIVSSGACASATSGVATITIHQVSTSGVVAAPNTVCENDRSVLTLTGNTGAVIQWEQSLDGTTGWGPVTEGSGSTSTVYTTPILSSTIYYRAAVKNGSCAVVNSNTASVSVKSVPDYFVAKDTLHCEGTQFNLNAPAGFSKYQWQNGSTNQSIIVTEHGTYWSKAEASNGCPVIDTIQIAPCNKITIPNVFTPGPDLLNPTFIIQGNIPNSTLEVYNRWGTKVYNNGNYDNTWDGHSCSDGIYYYIYKRPIDKDAHHGWVEIIR